MAPIESPRNRHVPLLPFIIALLLVKSKPSRLSCPDFRKQLASHIRKGPHPNHLTQADAHIDLAAFWRKKSTELEEANVALEAKVSRLQARVSELEERDILGNRKSAGAEDSARSQRLKRGRDGEPAEEHNGRSAKRARTKAGAVASDERDAPPSQNLIGDETGSKWDELGNNLLDSLRNLQRSFAAGERSPLGPKELALGLVSSATDICGHVSAIDLPANFRKVTNTALHVPVRKSKEQVTIYPQAEPADTIEQRLAPIARMFPHLLFHLHTLSQFSGSGNLCGQVVYRFVDVFRVLFQRIRDLAIANAKSNLDGPRTTTEKRDGGRKKQRTASASDDRPATSPIIMKLCKLVVSMLLHLDPTNFRHEAIFEGYFYLLLTRVGQVLKDFTIGARPFGIEVDATISTHNSHAREGRQLRISSVVGDEEASEAQAPYLIWILRRTQRLSSRMGLATSSTTIPHDNHRQCDTAHQDSSQNAIYDDARIRLQNTLVGAIFGDQFAANFEPALEPPRIPPDGELTMEVDTQIGTANIRDWFKNEVWRIVGWDILRGNIAQDRWPNFDEI